LAALLITDKQQHTRNIKCKHEDLSQINKLNCPVIWVLLSWLNSLWITRMTGFNEFQSSQDVHLISEGSNAIACSFKRRTVT